MSERPTDILQDYWEGLFRETHSALSDVDEVGPANIVAQDQSVHLHIASRRSPGVDLTVYLSSREVQAAPGGGSFVYGVADQRELLIEKVKTLILSNLQE